MKTKTIAPLRYLASLLLLVSLFTVACKQENKVGETNMLYGTESKVWKTDKETTATGEKDKLTSAEKKEEIQFFANGSFSMRSPTQNASGKWTYDAMAKKLSLQFVGSDKTENFQVSNLSDDELTMVAEDGSQMVLEAD